MTAIDGIDAIAVAAPAGATEGWRRRHSHPAPAFVLAVSRALGTVVVTVHGNLDHSASSRLGRVLADVIHGQGNLTVVIDLRDLDEVGPAGLGVLVDAARGVEDRGGRLRFSGPGPGITDDLRSAGLAGHVVAAQNARNRDLHPAGSGLNPPLERTSP